MTASTTCPECDAQLTMADDTETGEIVACGECGVDLEVRGVAPPRLELAPPEEEDWGE